MSVTVTVILEELPGTTDEGKTRHFQIQQMDKLLDLREACLRTLLSELGLNNEDLTKSRHFWFNGKYQPYRDRDGRTRVVGNITDQPAFSMRFALDNYLVHLPSGKRLPLALDADERVQDILKKMHEQGMIRDVCCYDLWNVRNDRLDMERNLWEQDTLPTPNPKRAEQSLLTFRLQKPVGRGIWLRVLAAALLGLVIGLFLHAIVFKP